MKARQTKRRSAIYPIVVLTFLVAACGSAPEDSNQSTTSTSVASTSSTTSGSQPTQTTQAENIGGSVSVLFAFGAEEVDTLEEMLGVFEEITGVTVEPTYSRDAFTLLRTAVESGSPPDVADVSILPILREYAASGDLQPLDSLLDLSAYKADTAPGVVELGVVDDAIYGVNWSGAVKGLIWYNPGIYTAGTPTNWDDLQAKAASTAEAAGPDTRMWCVALASGPASGWPGTDWIEDFVLRQSGPDVYDDWAAGRQKWSSPEIREAFEAFGEVVAPDSVFGGTNAVLATDILDGGNGLFTEPPGCVFHHQASFMPQFFEAQGGARPDDYEFLPFPEIAPQFGNSVIGSGNYMGMFNDTPQARAFVSFFASAEAQAMWVAGGGGLSANQAVTDYPNDLLARQADILASAEIFRYDGSDLMPLEMNEAFFKAMLDYTQHPGSLDQILEELDAVQERVYDSD